MVVRERWVNTITYSYKMKKTNKPSMIRLMSSMLFTLSQAGWDPLAPLDMVGKRKKKKTMICFRKRSKIVRSFNSIKSLLQILGLGT